MLTDSRAVNRLADRRAEADRVAVLYGVQPSVADWWLWIRWAIANGAWDGYHVGRGRVILREHV